MAEKTYALMKLREIINGLNQIDADYHTGSYSAMDMSGAIMLTSENIADNCIRAAEIQQNFSSMSAKLVQELTIRQRMTDSRYAEWYDSAVHTVKVGFLLMMADADTDKTCDQECISMLVDFCQGDSLTDVTAHYFAATLLGALEPRKCYDLIMEDFRKYPNLLDTLYNGCGYTYDPEQSRDSISLICPICGSNKSEPYYCADQAKFKNPSFAPAKLWMKCISCHNLYAYNFPIQARSVINGHYTNNSSHTLPMLHHLSIYSDMFNNIKLHNSGSRYLEIGVGCGEMLACALEMGYQAEAVEICREDCENVSRILGVNIKCADFLEYETSKKYDVIVMGDVLEHVSEPVRALEKAYDMLAPDGILWLSTPNYESAFTRMNGFNDPMWNQMNHFTYFSFNGLKPMLDKIGFDVRRYDISNRYSGSMELILQKR